MNESQPLIPLPSTQEERLQHNHDTCNTTWLKVLKPYWVVYRKYVSNPNLFEFVVDISSKNIYPEEIELSLRREGLTPKDRVLIVQLKLECSLLDAWVIKCVLCSSIAGEPNTIDVIKSLVKQTNSVDDSYYNGIGFVRYVKPQRLSSVNDGFSQIALSTAGPINASDAEKHIHSSVALIATLLIPLSWNVENFDTEPTSLTKPHRVLGIINSILFLYSIILSTGFTVFSSIFSLSEPGAAHYFAIHPGVRYSPVIVLMINLLFLFPLEFAFKYWDGTKGGNIELWVWVISGVALGSISSFLLLRIGQVCFETIKNPNLCEIRKKYLLFNQKLINKNLNSIGHYNQWIEAEDVERALDAEMFKSQPHEKALSFCPIELLREEN